MGVLYSKMAMSPSAVHKESLNDLRSKKII